MKRAYAFTLAISALFLPIRPGAAQSGSAVVANDGSSDSCAATLRLDRPTLTGPRSEFARAAELAGIAPPRSNLIRRPSAEAHTPLCDEGIASHWGRPATGAGRIGPIELRLLPIGWASHYNSAYPRDRNNGALWAGRGLSTELRGGVALRWGPLSAALAPSLLYQQNRDFELPQFNVPAGYSPYIYPGRPGTIDWPRRPGERTVRQVDPGQSHIRLDLFHLALGLSNENLWWGPAARNPLLMSNTAPGFQHLFFGTSKPIDLWIGRFEGEAIWGRLEESDFFDENSANDRRLLASIVFTFEPRGLRGLYLGAARSYLRDLPAEGLPLGAWLLDPYRDVRHNPLGRGNPNADNQLFSVFARWAPPRTGFEAYFEFARDDHWEDLGDLIAEPDASRFYTLGIQKLIPRGEGWLRLSGEATQIADPLSTLARPLFTIYAHGQLRQGYTHRGRILGAPIGPNANSQYLGLDRFTPDGRRGIYLERIRYNVDANSERWVRTYGAAGADIEFTVGLHQHLFLGDFELGWALTHSYRQNRNQIGLRRPEPEVITERNWGLRLDLGWRPQLGRPPSDPYSSTR